MFYPYILSGLQKGFSVFLTVLLLSSIFMTGNSAAQEPTQPAAGDIQKTIDVLEDEQRRQELITLLKLMAVIDEKRPDQQAPQQEAPAVKDNAPVDQKKGLKAWFDRTSDELWRDLSSSGIGLRQSWRAMKKSLMALGSPEAVSMWRPYVLYVFSWGLLCLVAIGLIMRKYGQRPDLPPNGGFEDSFNPLVKYSLVLIIPNLVLVVTLLLTPRLNSASPGVTADMAIGFSFVHAFIQHFFINLSLLYIGLRLGDLLLKPDGQGRILLKIPAGLAGHFRHSWRVFIIYLAVTIFVQQTFLENFAVASLYTVFSIVVTFPVPIYLTFRMIKLKRLLASLAAAEASSATGGDSVEAMANTDVESETVLDQKGIKYQSDRFFHEHWAILAISSIWILSLISLINPAGAASLFTGRLIGSLAAVIVSFSIIKAQRHLVLRWADEESDENHELVQKIDALANVIVWFVLLLSLTLIWGFPLESFLENAVTRDIMGRALAIGITIAVLVVFIRLSRLATEWLLAVPSWGSNRSWRTMTPLVLTTVRALAIFVGTVVILERLGVNVGPILAGAGILGLGVGMGAQSLVKDVINGASILLMDTLSVGDYVTIGGKSGTVEAVGLRSIRLRDTVGNLTVVPNSSIDVIVNQTRDYSREIVDFTVPYDADPDSMLKLAGEVGRDLSQDPFWRLKLNGPVDLVGIIGFDSNGTTIRLRVDTKAGDQWAVGRELRLRLKRRLLQEGINSTGFGQNVFYFSGDKGDPTAAPPLGAEPGRLQPDSTSQDDGGNDEIK